MPITILKQQGMNHLNMGNSCHASRHSSDANNLRVAHYEVRMIMFQSSDDPGQPDRVSLEVGGDIPQGQPGVNQPDLRPDLGAASQVSAFFQGVICFMEYDCGFSRQSRCLT